MLPPSKNVILIAGPTAVGKTSVAVDIAKHFNTEIISADSRQCYKELTIGVARPSEEELALVPHHFIASHSIHQKVTAALFEEYALQKATELFQQHNTIVMVGGTGLYLKAFAEGMDPVPAVPADVHNEVVLAYRQEGLEWLQRQIKLLDPLFWRRGETENPRRMMRALEVIKATGQSIVCFQKGEKKRRPFNVVPFALDLPKENLHQNINTRVDAMMKKGLLNEAASLLPHQHLNALQTVGYREMFACLSSQCSLSGAVDAVKKNTRQYAKRQLTWFRKNKEYTWLPPEAKAVIERLSHLQG